MCGDLGDDQVFGGDGDDFVNGNPGNDVDHGGKDDDTVRGGQGNDLAHGDLDNDLICADLDEDIIFGGEGNNIIVYCGDDGQDIIEDACPRFDRVRCEGVHIQIRRNEGNDLLLEMSDGELIRVRNQLIMEHLEGIDGC